MRPLFYRVSIATLFAILLAALVTASCTDEPSAELDLAATLEPPVVTVEPSDTCAVHAHGEEHADDDCCGCHYFGSDECAETCDPDPPEPDEPVEPVVTTDTVTAVAVTGHLEHGPTYYRIGKGAEPKEGEYEYLENEMGENGKIRKNGGAENKGVSFYTTQEDAEKARDRIPGLAGAKIHKVSSYNDKLLTFVGKQPPANHVHCVPNKEMTLAEYKKALGKIKLTKVE